MSNLQNYLKKKKSQKEITNIDLKSFVGEHTEAIAISVWESFKPQIEKKIEQEISKMQKMCSTVLNMQNKVKDGVKGEKGDSIKGDKGDSIQGEKGDPGEMGSRGDIGPRGIGIDGKDGKDGKEGSPDKPKEIVGKINTLTEAIEPKAIKGLEQTFKDYSKAINESSKKVGGGGGSGNWVPEAPSGLINSSNTTFILTNNPATQGKALILLYNGQVLEWGNQFTISGKTITTLFTPETGSYLFAMYMRS